MTNSNPGLKWHISRIQYVHAMYIAVYREVISLLLSWTSYALHRPVLLNCWEIVNNSV